LKEPVARKGQDVAIGIETCPFEVDEESSRSKTSGAGERLQEQVDDRLSGEKQ
jgi:hypothetical protein